MKKTLKRTCAVALALAATAGVSGVDKVISVKENNQISNAAVFAENSEVTEGVLKITKYKKSVTLGETFAMPTATLGGTAVSEYTVTTPSGKVLDKTAVDAVNGNLVIDEIGTYTITYTSGDYVGEVTFVSSVSTYNIVLETNNDKILPAKVSKDYAGDIYVPTYKITDKNGEEVTDDVDVKISVTAPDFSTLNVEDGKIAYTSLVKGTYTVTYSVYTKDGNFVTKTSKEFKCVDGDAYETDDKLILSYSNEKPESVNVGKTITLPSLSGKVGSESVPVYYTIEIRKNGSNELVAADTQVGNTDKVVLKKNDAGKYEFTANEIVDFYTVKYTAKSALGDKQATTEFIIETVEDSLDPTPIVVEPYETDDVDDLKNVDYKLKSNFNSQNIEILPIYAEDLGTFKFEDFKFKREIRNSSYEVLYTEETASNKTILFNSTYAEGQEPSTCIVAKKDDGTAITLTDGTYYVYYTATDASGNEETINYKFVVNSLFDGKDENGEVKPVVTFNDVFFDSVDEGEDITFSKVTFSDDNDERLETSVYFEYQDENDAVLETKDLELNENNKYVISTGTMPTGTAKVVIYAKAVNDSGFKTVESKTIKINSEITGTEAPKVISVATYEATVVQGTEVVIPQIVFEDDIVSSLDAEISIVCKTADNKLINYDAYNAMAIRNQTAKTYTFANASFVAATAGTYTVAVKATDAAGNVVIKFLTYTATDASYTGKLRFTNIGLTDTTIELGETYKLPTANIVGTDSNLYSYEVRLKSGPSGYKLNNDKFIPSKVGDYTLEYVMYETANPSNIITAEGVEVNITVEDSTKPEIYVNWKASIVDDAAATGEILGAYEKGTKLLLPIFSAYDLSGIDASKSMITITCSSSSSSRVIHFNEMAEEYAKGENGTMMYYTFAKDGEYTITYTAYDKAGNSDKKVFTIKVGDLDAPEFEVEDNIVASSYNVGDEIKIDLNDDSLNCFTISDKDTTIEKTDIKIALTVNGVEVKNKETASGKYSFKLEDAGEYELKFTVKDSAGNASEVVKTFTIAEKSSEGMTQSETMLTVMIVLSVVVLAGVVVYFVISKKKMDRLYK